MAALQRILVDHAGQKGIGDIVCEIGLYPALKRQHPGAMVVSRHSRTLAWGHPDVDAFDEASPDEAFDQVIRLGHAKGVYGGLPQALAEGRTIFDHFLVRAGLPLAGRPPELFVMPEEMATLGLEDDGGEGLIISYSADSVEPYRRWGPERFEALARHLEAAHGASLIELGSGVTAGHLGVGLDLVGATDLRQTMAVLALSDLFIGNHGGLTHIAGAVGTPILSPWGASHPYGAYAYDGVSVAVETPVECRHCHWREKALAECVAAHPLTGRTPCTQAISVEAMVEAFEALLPRLRAGRQALKAAKAARMARACDPRALARFDRQEAFQADALIQLYVGGAPAGWGPEHRVDDFAKLKKVVAFPAWGDPASQWKQLLINMAGSFTAESPWLLVFGAHPLTGNEVLGLLERFLTTEWRPQRPLPKILVLAGTFAPEARQSLLASAEMVLDEQQAG